MKRFDQSSASCQVFTFKEGLLSGFAHDLRIDVRSFVIDIADDYSVNARFDARSLHVDCVMADGTARPDVLKDWEKGEIDRNISRDVLHADKYPEIVLISSSIEKRDAAFFVEASLSLHGHTSRISFEASGNENYVADVWLHLPDFGIKPFSALFGAIRIKPDILIRVRVPQEG